MRKLFQESKWQKHSEGVARKELLKRQEKKQGINKKITLPVLNNGKVIERHHGKAVLVAPENFSLISNVEETLDFFDIVTKYINGNQSVYLDIAGVKKITTDSILYMLSLIDYSKIFHRRAAISGNAPDDSKCNEIFMSSGFYKYVYASNQSVLNRVNSGIYSIQMGKKTLVDKAEGIVYFTNKCLERPKLSNSNVTYPLLIECMTNTHNHAYKESILFEKWWLMASHNEETKRVHFTFLDNGMGIPKTIRKNFKEKILSIFGDVLPIDTIKDCDLICSALRGELRTRTGDSFRGKGLPKIYESVKSKTIYKPVIISRKGYVDCSTLAGSELSKVFRGTLYSWYYV